MTRASDSYPLRKIVATEDRKVGEHPKTGEPVIYSWDILECGHEKRIAVWRGGGRLWEAPNTNRRCEPCFKEGRK